MENKNVKCSNSFTLQVEKHCCTYYPLQAQKILRCDWSKMCLVRAKCFPYYLPLRVWWKRDGHTHLAITSKPPYENNTRVQFADIPEASNPRYNANRTGQNWLSDTLFKILSATLVGIVAFHVKQKICDCGKATGCVSSPLFLDCHLHFISFWLWWGSEDFLHCRDLK